jgi:hypothetical protein
MRNPIRRFIEQNSLRRDLEELRDLTVKYVKEETVDPIQDLGRYAAYGALGSVFVGLGSLLFLVGLLRILQTETAVFHGNWSWVPYLIVVVAGVLIVGVVVWRVASGPAKRRLPKPEESA